MKQDQATVALDFRMAQRYSNRQLFFIAAWFECYQCVVIVYRKFRQKFGKNTKLPVHNTIKSIHAKLTESGEAEDRPHKICSMGMWLVSPIRRCYKRSCCQFLKPFLNINNNSPCLCKMEHPSLDSHCSYMPQRAFRPTMDRSWFSEDPLASQISRLDSLRLLALGSYEIQCLSHSTCQSRRTEAENSWNCKWNNRNAGKSTAGIGSSFAKLRWQWRKTHWMINEFLCENCAKNTSLHFLFFFVTLLTDFDQRGVK